MRTICDTVLDDARGRRAHRSRHGATSWPCCIGSPYGSAPRGRPRSPSPVPDTLAVGVPAALLERIVSPARSTTRCATPGPGSPSVSAPGPDGIRVEVIDDGPGVPASFTAHLFQPGRRADPGDGHGGAGLGLPLARRLARSAGGEVTHDAGHTPGACFVVSLPAG